MKRIRLLSPLFILLLTGTITLAQDKMPIRLGLKVAPNLGWMAPKTEGYNREGARLGGTLGFVSDFFFAERYAISTGFNFLYANGHLSYRDNRLMTGDTVVEPGLVDRKYSNLYFEIPLMIKMSTKRFNKISFFGQVGLGTGFRIKSTANEHFTADDGGEMDQQYSFDGGTTLIRESILVGLGGEYHLDSSSGIFFGFSYSNSLNNIFTGTNNLSKEGEKSMLNYLELNLGIMF
jgi:hypothetical protein